MPQLSSLRSRFIFSDIGPYCATALTAVRRRRAVCRWV